MGITDWNAWMKEHHIYIPTEEEVEEAKRKNLVKVRAMKKMLDTCNSSFEAYKEIVEAYKKKEAKASRKKLVL